MPEIVVLVTTGSQEESARIGHTVVQEGLVACANIIPTIQSIFQWEGKVVTEGESLLVLKTHDERFDELCKKIKSLHRYDVPEIIALPIVYGSHEYLEWVRGLTIIKKQGIKKEECRPH